MLKLEVTLNDMKYSQLVASLLPRLLESAKEKNDKVRPFMELLKRNNVDLVSIINLVLNNFTDEQINGLLVDAIHQYGDDIVVGVNEALFKQDIGIELNKINLIQV